jgi:hypothetical protein
MGLGLKSGIEIEQRNIETPNGFPALNHSTFGYPLLPAPKSLQDYLNEWLLFASMLSSVVKAVLKESKNDLNKANISKKKNTDGRSRQSII